MIIKTSARPAIHHAITSATTPPKAPETVVLTIMVGTSAVSPRVAQGHYRDVVTMNGHAVFAETTDAWTDNDDRCQ
jgi:hypothetical protein